MTNLAITSSIAVDGRRRCDGPSWSGWRVSSPPDQRSAPRLRQQGLRRYRSIEVFDGASSRPLKLPAHSCDAVSLAASATRELTSSFRYACARCDSTVLTVTNSCWAICLLL